MTLKNKTLISKHFHKLLEVNIRTYIQWNQNLLHQLFQTTHRSPDQPSYWFRTYFS